VVPAATIPIPIDHRGAKTKTKAVVVECGSVSSGVKNQATTKNNIISALMIAKTAEMVKRCVGSLLALARRIRPNVGGIQSQAQFEASS
jgi:hypothetical protein